ncbi:MAG: 4a-hydroxytetrahydrobiopterin dehydratase [Bdellovibrionales bacterium GWB1_55_8]|nr:MAG: 4a-hydroxytetrahydrobiopterin dehydratase [Bdellovibrionales bacterium GWB1_55_8]
MGTQTSDLAAQKCQPCEGGTPPLSNEEIQDLLQSIEGWKFQNGQLHKAFDFKNYHHTIAFVNALAWVSHRENHHPDLEVSYNRCKVSYVTHAIGGLSKNDFICAAKTDRLFEP